LLYIYYVKCIIKSFITSLPREHIHHKLLVDAFKNSNQKAFQKLFEFYWEGMFYSAKVIVVSEDAAKDVVQDIWINLWENRQKLEIRNIQSYLFTAVRYECFKYLKNHKFNTVQLEIIKSLKLCTEPTVKNLHDLEETQISIDTALCRLSPRCRQIFKLSRIHNTSNDEIAVRLGISKRSVENQISIALKYIRQNLTPTRFSIYVFVTTFL